MAINHVYILKFTLLVLVVEESFTLVKGPKEKRLLGLLEVSTNVYIYAPLNTPE